MLASNLTAFHRWFLGRTTSAPAIVLHGFPDLPPGLAAAVARHLNEFDEDSGGEWTAFAPELIRTIAESQHQRNLLGLGEGCKNCPPASPCGQRKVLEAIARRGNAVLDHTHAVEATKTLSNAFRVSLGPALTEGVRFHVTLRPELFCDRALPSIIADTYLEWSATREMADTV